MIKKYYDKHPQEVLDIFQETFLLGAFDNEMWILHKDIIEGSKVKNEIYHSPNVTL